MHRLELFEIHDHHRCPAGLRNLCTDALQAVWVRFDTYRPIAPLLRSALEESKNDHVVDLCSGAGGPWLRLARNFKKQAYQVRVLLTDLYPNIEGFEQTSSECESIKFCEYSVSALRVPSFLNGFRTIFSSFHHFPPDEACTILSDAAEQGQGIAIFESAARNFRVMLTICFLPPIVLFITPWIHPFRWSRIFWTYLIPIVPFTLWFDGIMSCLRSYSKDELLQFSREVNAKNYQWHAGTMENEFVPITYLIGYPTKTASCEVVLMGRITRRSREHLKNPALSKAFCSKKDVFLKQSINLDRELFVQKCGDLF